MFISLLVDDESVSAFVDDELISSSSILSLVVVEKVRRGVEVMVEKVQRGAEEV